MSSTKKKNDVRIRKTYLKEGISDKIPSIGVPLSLVPIETSYPPSEAYGDSEKTAANESANRT